MTAASVKHALARITGSCYPLDRLIGRPGRRYVMAYHRVIAAQDAARDHVHAAMWISPATFVAQLRWMRAVGAIVDLETLLASDDRHSGPMFALTFDDGWRDNYEIAFPLLRTERAPATIFLASDAIETGLLFWPEDVVTKTQRVVMHGGGETVRAVLAEMWPDDDLSLPPVARCEAWMEVLKRLDRAERNRQIDMYLRRINAPTQPLPGYIMTWDQAREMAAAGVTFGSHTHTHQILEGLEAAEIERELILSRRIIAERLQREVTLFCYPNARYTGQEGPLLANAGYRYAFGIDGRQVRAQFDPYYVPRFLMNERVARNPDFVRLHLLEAPVFAGRPHRPRSQAAH